VQTTVDTLINRDSNWWNVPYIKSIFSADVVAQICSLGISPRSQVDRLIWTGTKNGEFSVRSAYYLEVERRNRSVGCGSLTAWASPFWKIIWNGVSGMFFSHDKSRIGKWIWSFLSSTDYIPLRFVMERVTN
jgi:hypothetical protein